MFVAMEKSNWFLVKSFSILDSKYILKCYTQCGSWSLKKNSYLSLNLFLFEFACTIYMTSGFQETPENNYKHKLDSHDL